MRSPRLLLGSLGAAAATIALVTVTSMPASAAGPYVVRTGSTTTGNATFTAATIGTVPQIQFTTSGGLELGCDSGTARGLIRNGTSSNGLNIATITGTVFTNCVGPAGLNLDVAQVGNWRIDATGPVTSGGLVRGRISGVNARVTSNPAGACSFDVKGTVGGFLAQRPTNNQQLRVGGSQPSTLRISNVAGCFGAISNGQTATFDAIYKISSPQGVLSITQP